MRSYIKYSIITVILVSVLAACTSPWDEHIAVQNLRGKTLMQAISENPQTTVFATILEKTGYNILLSGDIMLTVFVPTNDALSGVDLNNVETLKNLVKNHIAYASYTISKGSFNTDKIQMINEKFSSVNGLKISEISLFGTAENYNIATANGMMHLISGIIPLHQNIYEYLQSQTGNLQAEFIKNQDKLIMDTEKSVQIGVNTNGKPIYDTVWINQNKFLEKYPLNDETKSYTYILLPNDVLERIETKYAQYFAKPKASEQDSITRYELIKDCILAPVTINADGKYISIDGVKMDISTANIIETYTASNGLIYKLSDADVKIYENKVKTIFIEAENYDSIFADVSAAWSVRNKTYLHGGKDLLMNSRTRCLFNEAYTPIDSLFKDDIYFQNSSTDISTAALGKVNNCFIQFKPIINSVTYKIYWSAYDDIPWHYNGTKYSKPVKFSMKMLMSFPEKPVVQRSASATILNNFNPYTAFTSVRFTAGVQDEKQLFRAELTTNETNYPFFILNRNYQFTSEENYYKYYPGKDALGDKETLICPTYGKSTILVANTTENTTTYAGPILLDYIKLVPQVDPNE